MARLNETQAMLEATEKEVNCYMPQIQDLEHVNSKLRSTYCAKDVELTSTPNDVTCLQKVASRLKFKKVELQNVLFANENLKNE